MSDKQQSNSTAPPEFLEELQNFSLGLAIERTGRFVGDQELGFAHQGLRDGYSLALPAT
jgi:hypothetical protein